MQDPWKAEVPKGYIGPQPATIDAVPLLQSLVSLRPSPSWCASCSPDQADTYQVILDLTSDSSDDRAPPCNNVAFRAWGNRRY